MKVTNHCSNYNCIREICDGENHIYGSSTERIYPSEETKLPDFVYWVAIIVLFVWGIVVAVWF